MKYKGDQVLNIMSNYAINRNNAIFNLINNYLYTISTSDPINLLEFGAGKGEFLNRFTNKRNIVTHAVEIDDKYIKILKEKHKVYKDLKNIDRKLDFVFSIDVFEHIKSDKKYLKKINHILVNNGLLFIYVPARPELYSSFDKSMGHHRRYTLKELVGRVETANFTIKEAYYHDFLGYFAAIFNKFTSKGSLNPKAVKIYDKIFFPITNFIERLYHLPIGKSIVLIAQKA